MNLTIPPATGIRTACKMAVAAAIQNRRDVSFDFEGVRVTATPYSGVELMVENYYAARMRALNLFHVPVPADRGEQLAVVRTNHTNATMKHGDMSIPVTYTGDSVITVWKCASWLARLKFLFTGRISLTVPGDKMPALELHASDFMDGRTTR